MNIRLRWGAVVIGFLATAVCALVISPLLARIGVQVDAGPVDMLTMVSILIGGFVAGRLARRYEGMHGAVVAVLYILVIRLVKQGLDEVHLVNLSGLGALGQLDRWGNFGKDLFHLMAGTLGGLWATPFNERERRREHVVLRTAATTRGKPKARPAPPIARDDLSP